MKPRVSADVSYTLIEDKGSGTSLIQDLRCENVNVIAIKPEGDKLTRLYSVQGKFEAGAVFFPRDAPWLPDLRAELLQADENELPAAIVLASEV